jgi:hypothetical protein
MQKAPGMNSSIFFFICFMRWIFGWNALSRQGYGYLHQNVAAPAVPVQH